MFRNARSNGKWYKSAETKCRVPRSCIGLFSLMFDGHRWKSHKTVSRTLFNRDEGGGRLNQGAGVILLALLQKLVGGYFFLYFWGGKSCGNIAGFLFGPTKIKAQTFRGKFRSIFLRENPCLNKKYFVPDFLDPQNKGSKISEHFSRENSCLENKSSCQLRSADVPP